MTSPTSLVCIVGVYILLLSSVSNAYQICPGTGLTRDHLEIVIFEHTEMGTGGLVLNCPTPLTMERLCIPQFQPYKELPLMLGCGIMDTDQDDNSNLPLGDVAPWFWLHDLDDIPGSFVLEGAAGPLYMGGDIQEATKKLEQEHINPRNHFKFFRKYVIWESGKLQQEMEQGKWKVTAQDPVKALETVMLNIRM